MIVSISPVDVRSEGFLALLRPLNDELGALYPAESNHLDSVDALAAADAFAVGAFHEGRQVGCGAFKRMSDDGVYAEVKRVYVTPEFRGCGISGRILTALEDEMRRRGFAIARLETGVAMPAPLALYASAGYQRRGPFGGYRPDPASAFFEKQLGRGN